MLSFQLKIITNAKKQESRIHTEEKRKRQSIETVPEDAQTLDLLDEGF